MQAVSTEIFKDAQPDVLQNRSSASPAQQEQKKKRCNTVSAERFAMASTAERKTHSQGCPQPALRASVKAGPRAASPWAAKVCTGACERKPSARAPPAKEQNKTSTERMTHEQSTAVIRSVRKTARQPQGNSNDALRQNNRSIASGSSGSGGNGSSSSRPTKEQRPPRASMASTA
jgi:hypothetical protein